MHSKADLIAGIPPSKPREQRPARPLLRIRKFVPRRQRFKGTKSGFKGVIHAPHCKLRPWKSYIRHHGQYVTIGYFPTKEKAAQAYNRLARSLFGPAAFLNDV